MIHIGFLGGISEFGNNCSFIRYKDEIIIIDIGFKFYTDNEMGIRYEIPDFSYLIQNRKKIKGVLITHGHLDHIGGIPYFLDHINCDIYASPFTQHLIKKQLKNNRHLRNLKTINEQKFKLGSFTIEPYSVTHSIIDSMGFIIHTPLKDNTKIITCGDINYDNHPFHGNPNNFSSIDKYYKSPKVLLLDSTNATEKGYNTSETQVYQEIDKIFKEFRHKRRFVFTTFSTQIQRLLGIIDSSIKHHIKVVALGKSIFNNLSYILEKKEYKKYKNHVFYSEDQLKDKEKVTVIATGSQGEENSAISKILDNKIKQFRVNKDDLFVFSSSIIPGNENRIFEIWNHIYFAESEVISYRDRNIHSSGHGKIDELKKIIKKIKPDYLIPIHGEYRNLYNQKKLAMECNLKAENICMAHKGDIIKISDEKKHKINLDHNLHLKNIILDREDHVIDKKTIHERKKMVENGILMISIPQNSKFNEIRIKGLGISNFTSNEENFLKEKIFNELGNGKKDRLENIVKDFFRKNNISRPLVVRI